MSDFVALYEAGVNLRAKTKQFFINRRRSPFTWKDSTTFGAPRWPTPLDLYIRCQKCLIDDEPFAYKFNFFAVMAGTEPFLTPRDAYQPGRNRGAASEEFLLCSNALIQIEFVVGARDTYGSAVLGSIMEEAYCDIMGVYLSFFIKSYRFSGRAPTVNVTRMHPNFIPLMYNYFRCWLMECLGCSGMSVIALQAVWLDVVDRTRIPPEIPHVQKDESWYMTNRVLREFYTRLGFVEVGLAQGCRTHVYIPMVAFLGHGLECESGTIMASGDFSTANHPRHFRTGIDPGAETVAFTSTEVVVDAMERRQTFERSHANGSPDEMDFNTEDLNLRTQEELDQQVAARIRRLNSDRIQNSSRVVDLTRPTIDLTQDDDDNDEWFNRSVERNQELDDQRNAFFERLLAASEREDNGFNEDDLSRF